MQDSFGQPGWREFHRNRKNILEEYDKILDQTANRPVQVAHGIGVEAFLRKWLSEFLPKKFGVTSGYIIPNLYNDNGKLYHYDVIIYNQLEAPILWTEGDVDDSEQGKFRAIPAKYVMAVYEVKSRLTKKNVSDALSKLDQLSEFATDLNRFYTCGIIFIDLKLKDVNKESIIKELIKGKDIHRFIGGMVLRFEGDITSTGKIDLHISENKEDEENEKLKPLAKPIDDLNIFGTEDGQIKVNEQGAGIKLVKTDSNSWSISKLYGVMYRIENTIVHLSWSRNHFSDFCMQLLSHLEGLPYNDPQRPSFGQVFDNLETPQTPIQAEAPKSGEPFLDLSLDQNQPNNTMINYERNGKAATINISFIVENKGSQDLVISDDSFKNKLQLAVGQKAIKNESYKIALKEKHKNIDFPMKREKFQIPYRLVYYVENGEKKFFAIEKTISIEKGKVMLA